MKLKQFIFALVAMLSSFAFTANAQTEGATNDVEVAALFGDDEFYVSCDYNSSTSGWGTTKFSNYDAAFAKAKSFTGAKYRSATIIIEKTNTLSGNCLADEHDGYTKLAVVVKDGATIGVAISKWDMTYPVTVKPGGAIVSARGKSSGYINSHIKNTLTIGSNGADKKAVLDFLGGSYQSGSVSIMYNGKIVANNATIEVGDFGLSGTGTFNNCDITVGGVLATGKNNNYKQTMTNTTVTVGGTNYQNENTYYSTEGTLLHNLTLDNSTIAVGEGDGVVVKTVTLKNGSAWTVAEGASVNTTNAKVTVYGSVEVPEELANNDTANELVSNTAVSGYTPKLPTDVTNLTVELTKVEETKVTFNVEPKNASGNKVSETSEITFRLPVPAAWAGKKAVVYHDGTAMPGTYTVHSGNYVEVKSSQFSEFAVELFVPVAKIGDTEYATLSAAFAAVTDDNQTVVICKDVTENLTGAYLRGNITTENGAEVTITLTNSDWVNCPYTFVLGENITLNVPALFYYAGGSQINGTVVAGAYYQRYASTKLTINEPGSMTVTGETCIIRYMDGDANAGIYINGDNDPSTVGLKLSVAYFYQGMINAKDANIVTGTYWQTNDTDGQGSANLVLDNSTLTVTVYDHPAKATGNSTVTLTNGSVIDAKNGGFTYGDNATLSVDATSKIIGKNGALVELPVAKIGTTKYTSLQAAINAVQNDQTITLIADITENVTLTEKTGLYYTIDGNGNKMNGTITISSLSDTNDNRRITIKGINFVTTEGRDFITSTATNHYPRLTVEGCSFTGTGKDAADCVAIRLKSSHSVVIKDCTGTSLHSFLQNTAGWNLTIENVTVTDSKSGLALGTVQGVTVEGCDITADGYGIRLDAGYNNNAVIESNKVKSFIPVVVRKATVDSNITVQGTNTFIATNEDGLWMAIGTSEYETNGEMPTAATGKVRVTLNDTGVAAAGVYGAYVPVAKIGEVEYTSLEAAFKAATSGCEIVILADVTVDYAWDARYTGSKFLVPVTINGKGKTIKFTASVNDNNYQAPFRFEADATVKNLTIDMSEVTDNRFRAISSKGNLTVDGCKFIGKDESLNCRAIIFGEGAGANVGNLAIAITNSEFINWKRGITDNENGQDIKTATITGNTLENAAVYVSAYENVTFTGNTVEGAYVDIRSYTANSSLNVTATGNTLEENTDTAYNYIKATGNIDQEGFKVYAVAKIGDVEYTTIEKAYAALQEGDEIVILKKGSYALKVKNNVTITGAVDGVEFANIGAFGCGGANVTFNNVTFTYAANSTYNGLQHSGNLVYNNCIFNGQVFLYGQSETFNKCTFVNTGDNYNVWTYGAANVAFNECTFSCDGKSVLVYTEGANTYNNVSVTKCQFNAAQAVVGKAAIEMDSSLSAGINLTIDGATTATGFGNGNVSGNSLWNNKKGQETEANNDITVTVGDEVVLKPIVLSLAGEGTEANPYLINNVEELLWFQAKVDEQAADGSTQYAGKYIKLTADIDLEGINWNPIGSMTGDHGSFKGVFDGDNHTISNLKIEQDGNGLGLFAYTSGNAVIKNLNLDNVTVKSTNNSNYVGGVVGNAYASTKIENVHVTGDVLISGRGYIGGIAGHGYVVMDNVSVVANEGGLITSTFWCAGGVLGYAGEGTTNIKNAHVEGLTVTSAAGGLGAIVGMAEDNNGTQPISGSNLSAKNVEIKTYVGDYGTSYADYALGYLYGGNETSKLTGDLVVENVTVETSSGVAPTIVDAVATVGDAVYFDFAAAMANANEGKTVKLFKDVVVAETFAPNGKTFTLDGNGKTISQAANCTNTYALFDITGGEVTIKNVTFDGVKGGAVVRTVDTKFAMDNVIAQNCEHTQQQGLFRLLGENTITNSTFKNNNCSMVMTINYDGASDTPQVVDNCLFEGNTVNGTAALYYVKGASFALTNSEFVNNTVNCNSNGATIYLGFQENCTVTGNLFQDNVVADASSSTRVAGAIFFGYAANISGNAFVNNTASNADGSVLGQVCASTYYNCTIDLGKNYWGGEAPAYGKDYTLQHQTGEGAFALDNYYTSYVVNEAGNLVFGETATINYAAKAGKLGYATIKAAVAAVKEGETITILAGTHSEGTIKLPATLKNVTIKGASAARSTEGAVLKDMTISAADGNSYSYVNLTFDGITFDNSRLLFTGWRNGEEVIENLTVTNCTFKNLNDDTNTAPVHINKDASEAVNGFTFTNNVIDGATGGQKSGIYAQVTGDVVVSGNVINNVSFRPYVIQVTTDDVIADNFTVTGNTFSGSAVGRAQGLGSNAEGTDAVNLVVSNNIFKGITDAQQICYWNFNAEKTTADLSGNYYDIDILANPGKIYYNSAAANSGDLYAKGVFPFYTELNEDGTIDTESAVNAYGVSTKAELNTAIAAAKEGEIIVMTADIDYGTDQLAITKAITFNLGGKTLTTRNAWGGMSIKNNPTITNGTIVHASNTAAIKVWNATAFEDLVIDVQGKGDANKTIGGIVLQSGSTTNVGSIKNVTIKGAALTNGIETYNCGDATENVIGAMENVTITAQGTGMLISAPCGTATNCSISGGVAGIELWIKGNYSATLGLENCQVEGGEKPVYIHDEFSSNPNIQNNGTLKLSADEATNFTSESGALAAVNIARAENVECEVVDALIENAIVCVDDVYFDDFAKAWAAVKAGQTVTLLADLEASEVIMIGKSMTINGDDHKVTSSASRVFRLTASNIEVTLNDVNMVDTKASSYTADIRGISIDAGLQNVKLTLNNSSVDFTDASACDWAYAVNVSGNGTGHTVTVNGGSYEGANVINAHGANNTIVVKDATLTSLYPNNDVYYGACVWVLENQGSSVTATGNTFNGSNAMVFNVGTGTTVTESNNTDNTTMCVAKIGNEYYTSLADAFAAGGEVKVLHDITLAETVTVPADKTITLDLNGKTISQEKACTGNYNMILNKGNLTITGEGKISFKDTGAGDPNYGWGSYTVRNEGTLVVENGTIEHLGEQAAHMYCAIFQYSGKSTINGGTISTPNYRSARLWKGEMTVNGGNFEGQLWVQAVDNTSNLEINGGTFAPRGNDGSSVFVTNSTYDVAFAVTDGTFNGKIGCSDATKLAGAITGGKFNEAAKANTAAALIATGYVFGEADANGYYTVADDPSTHYINNLADLKAFRDEVNSGENYYAGVNVYLAAHIDMADENWVGIGSATKDHGFMGNFDGQGYKIKNLTITDPALDSDGYAYAGLFAVTEGTDKDNQNTIKNLIIEDVTITTTGHIAAAAIAYPYYTIVDNVKVCGNIAIQGGDYTAGVLAYTRRCVNASNLSIIGENNSFVKGAQVVGGVISDIQMNGGLVAEYSNFSAEGVTVTGTKNVGGISGIIATQTLNGATVKNVTLNCSDARVGTVAGCLGGTSTISNVTVENVSGATALLGATYDNKAIEAKIGDTYYATLEAAYAAAQEGETITMLAPVVIAADKTLTLDKNVNVVYTSNVAGEDMFTNRGTLNISAGTITYVNTDATGSNVTVSTISSEPGSVLNITGGTVENKTVKADGSSIYSYAIDMLTNGSLGDVTATIAGGTVYSDYMAIRQFNNGDACKNTLNITGGYIYGAKRAVQIHMDNNAAVTAINGGKIEAGEGGYALCNFAATSDLAVTGGEFIGAVYSARENFISGGTYNNPVEAAYCAAGYMPNKNANGTYGVVAAQDAVAAVGGFAYVTLAEAVKACVAGDNTIELLADCAEKVTITQVNGTNIVINGNGKNYTGTITVKGDKVPNNYNTETLTFNNINFAPAYNTYAITAEKNTYARNITVDGCTFKGNNDVYGIRVRNGYNYTVKNTTAEGVYTFFNASEALTGLTVEDVTVKCANVAFAAASGMGNASFKNVTVESDNNGVKVNNPNSSALTFENCSIKAKTPVTFIENAGVTSALTAEFNGTNTMVVNNGGTYWFNIVEADATDATFKAIVNDANLDMSNTAFAASVGNVYYTTLQKAIDVAVNDDVVTLARDIAYTAEDAILASGNLKVMVNVAGKAISLDMNGKKISLDHQSATDRIYAVVSVEDGASLTVTGNGAIDVDVNDATPKVAYMFLKRGNNGTLVIQNGNYHMDGSEDSMVYTSGDDVVVINGGTFILDTVGTGSNGQPWIFNTKGQNDNQIIVNGGTFNADINHQYWAFEVYIAPDKAVKANGDGTTWTVVSAVAYITEKNGNYTRKAGYATLTDAIASVYGNEIVMLDNVALTETVVVPAGKVVVLDLNGKTVSMEDASAATVAMIKNEGNLTITDNSDAQDGKLSFKSTTPSASNAYASNAISNYGTLTINAGTVENLSTGGACYALDNYAGSAATINGGKLYAEKTAVRVFNWTNGEENKATLNVVDGEIYSADGYGINVNSGNAPYVALNISGGTITTDDTDYNLAVYVVNKNSAENFTVNVTGGTFNGIFALNGVTATTMAQDAVSITGGEFDGVICYADPAYGFISGEETLFNSEIPANYCATDWAPYSFGDGTWGVEYLYLDEFTINDDEYYDYVYSDFENQNNKTVGTLTYKRTLGSDDYDWNALYVPFEIPVSMLTNMGLQVAYMNDVRSYDKNSDGEIDEMVMESFLIKSGTLNANHPYIFRRTRSASAEINLQLSNVTLYSTAAENQTVVTCSSAYTEFILGGTYSMMTEAQLDGRLILGVDNKTGLTTWVKIDPNWPLSAFRLHLTIKQKNGSPVKFDDAAMRAIRIRVIGEENEKGETIIYDVEMDDQTVDYIYDLQGRRVLEPQKGNLYIINGKKVIF